MTAVSCRSGGRRGIQIARQITVSPAAVVWWFCKGPSGRSFSRTDLGLSSSTSLVDSLSTSRLRYGHSGGDPDGGGCGATIRLGAEPQGSPTRQRNGRSNGRRAYCRRASPPAVVY